MCSLKLNDRPNILEQYAQTNDFLEDVGFTSMHVVTNGVYF